MATKEATARIKINKLLEDAGWRFFDTDSGKANIVLEPNVKLTGAQVSALGDDFEGVKNGFIDFLLLDEKSAPLVVLEAKAEDKSPLIGKEQARKYARSQNCRFVLLSNGNLHYFWDLTQGSPYVISRFPGPESVAGYKKFEPNPAKLIDEAVEADYIALTQQPNYANEAGWKNETERSDFVEKNKLRFLREYQLRAVKRLQEVVNEGHSRFLFEMATGTGKTLTAAAIIKLFLRTGNARRVLFLVDRIELEDQANKAFVQLLKNDAKSVIYKEQRDDWRKAEIVVTTVQSLLFNGKYQRLFAPTDFDLVISDEAHRSIGGNARAVFEYFIGYKLGLTATPRDYLKRFEATAPTTATLGSWNAGRCWTPTALSAANRANPHSVTRCWMGCAMVSSSIPWWWMPAPTLPRSCFPMKGMRCWPSRRTAKRMPRKAISNGILRRSSFLRIPTACFAKRCYNMGCATR